ncbi:hypothetical protein ACQ4LE_001863 [Meloidogyne hapla]
MDQQLNFNQIRAKFIHNENHEEHTHLRVKSPTPPVPIKNGGKLISFHSHNSYSEEKLMPTRRAPNLPIDNNFSPPMSFSPIEEERPNSEHIEEKANYVKSVAERLNKMDLFRPIDQRRHGEIIVNDNENELRFSEAEIIQVADICDSDSEYSVISYSTTNDSILLNRRKSNPFESKEKLFADILSEMKNKDNFKRLAIQSGLPSDVGTLRNSAKKKCRKGRVSDPNHSFRENGECSRLVKSQTEPSQFPPKEENDKRQKTISMASTNSSSIYSAEDSLSEMPEVPFYNTGNEKENDRLRQIHFIVAEFYKVERGFVELLQHIGVNYPKYLEECQKRNGYKWLTPSKGSHSPGDVITRITNHLQMILAVHEDFLKSFENKLRNWDSRNPNFAEVFKNADYLKICNDFLKEKRTLTDEFIQYLKENSELALATRTFEQEGFTEQHKNNNNKINQLIKNNINKHYIALQLDKVHQNIVQYKSQMERYKKYLPENCIENEIADKALKKLEDVSSGVNQYLVAADNNELLELHRRLQGRFDVFEPGRKLLHKGELLRYTRKMPKARYLILFSDVLLICQYPSIVDTFDRFHKIKVEDIQLNIKDHVDYETEFTLISPQKSSSFGAKDKRERDLWVQRISEAKTKPASLTKLNNSLNNKKDLLENENGFENQKPSKIEFSTVAPEWMRDSKTTKCLIVGCETKFNLVKRRHHCRACGWIICGKCVGYAPVVNLEWERDIVCPECFEKTVIAFERGTLFTSQKVKVIKSDQSNEIKLPENCLKMYSINDLSLRILYEKDSRLLPLSKLFIMPRNGIRKRIIVKGMDFIDNSFPSGIVFLRNSRGVVLQRWARLLDQFCLNFYEAEFDDKPSESYFIYGYSVTSKETEKDGTVIELSHHNQIQTERKGDEIIFCVRHPGSATNWLNALNEMLQIDA